MNNWTEEDEKVARKFVKCYNNVKEEKDFIGFWKDYESEYDYDHNIIVIPSADRIFGIIRTKEAEKFDSLNRSWKTYSLTRQLKVKKTEMGRIYWNEYVFGLNFLMGSLKFFKSQDEFDVKVICAMGISILCIKITEDYSFAIGEIKNRGEYSVKEDGVWFVDEEYNEEKDEFVEKSRKFSKWINDRAVSKLGKSYRNKYLYKKEYFFEEIEEQGGFLML